MIEDNYVISRKIVKKRDFITLQQLISIICSVNQKLEDRRNENRGIKIKG